MVEFKRSETNKQANANKQTVRTNRTSRINKLATFGRSYNSNIGNNVAPWTLHTNISSLIGRFPCQAQKRLHVDQRGSAVMTFGIWGAFCELQGHRRRMSHGHF